MTRNLENIDDRF
jgi:hypothetical protein